MRKKIGIIGATGSIGSQAIDVILEHQDKFDVVFLSAHNSRKLLEKYGLKVKAKYLILTSVNSKELISVIQKENLDIVLSASVGFSGVIPTYEALKRGISVALANKESMVTAGKLFNLTAEKTGADIIPVDSEHSAIYQCLRKEDKESVEKVILTASGGPFRHRPVDSLHLVKVEEALKHPNWNMGNKVTIDSATMMNKGLELIEARYLFDLGLNKLDVVIHPESIIHSIVSFKDGSYLAQLGVPDMRVPIAYALSVPRRLNLSVKRLNFHEVGKLTFMKPSLERYPCLKLAIDALKVDKNSIYIALNAANEVAVNAFLNREISFDKIPYIIEKVMKQIEPKDILDIEEILEVDKLARIKAQELL